MENKMMKLMTARAENAMDASGVGFSHIFEHSKFPLVIKPKYTGLILGTWLKDNKELFNVRLQEYGAILLRGFKINTVEKFKDIIDLFATAPLEYKQRSSPRFEVARNIYHSTTYPADQMINMHSENSYSKHRVGRIVFCCTRPADEQGETPIADNRNVLKCLSTATREKFLQKGVKYVRNVSKEIGLSWEEVFQTNDKSVVEEVSTNDGMEFSWEKDGRLVLSWSNDAILRHPGTNEETWFNHAFFFNKYALDPQVFSSFSSDADLAFNTYFGDGSEISKEEIEEIRSAYAKATVVFPWEKGDILFLDNLLASHGRSPYKGEREVLVSMF